MNYYDTLLEQLRSASQRRPAPRFDPAEYAADQRGFRKSLASLERGMSRLAPPPVPKPRVPTPAETMAKAFEAFKAGRLSGDELRRLEAGQHLLVDAIATGGAR